jgi:hypothetical protein
MGIVAPTVGPDLRKDSVELLLDGISGSQPSRTKTTPQTDGEASASYHSRHDVRRAHTSPDEEPKVVIDHEAQSPTMRIERSQVPFPEVLAPTRELTLIPPVALWPRVVIAAGAGLVVVVCLFVVSRLAMRGGQEAETTAARPAEPQNNRTTTQAISPAIAAASATASAASAPTASPASSASPTTSASPATSAQAVSPSPSTVSALAPTQAASAGGAPPLPLATAGFESSEVRTTSATAAASVSQSAAPARPRPRPPIVAPASAARDLGELKTTFR